MTIITTTLTQTTTRLSPTYNYHLDDYNDDSDIGNVGIDNCDHDDDNNDYDDYGNLHRKLGETLCLLLLEIFDHGERRDGDPHA